MRVIPVLVIVLWVSCAPEKSRTTDVGTSVYKSVLNEVEFEGDRIYTGYKEVIENRETNQGRSIRIFVTVMPAKSDSVLSPVFHFEGGPGQPAQVATSYYARFPELNRHRDIVLIDARGTGWSNGLYCPALKFDAHQPEQAFEEMYPAERIQDCLDELKDTVDLSHYSTASTIEDVEEIRAWLGYSKINLIGFSYGTRAIEAYLRMYPESIRSVVMGGPAPASMHRPESFAKDAQRAWELICRDCSGDPACSNKYPQLDADMKALLTKLDKGPIPFTFHNQATGVGTKVLLRRGPVAEAIRTTMYATDGQRKLPEIIHLAAQGDYGLLAERMYRRSLSYSDLSVPLFLCITCSEDVPFIDEIDESNYTVGTFLGDYRIRREVDACKRWPRHAYSEDGTEPVMTDIPVLIVTGSHDPVTPPRWATEMSAGMSNVTLVTVPYMAHSAYGMSNLDCLSTSYEAFFDRPVAGFQMTCVSQMKPGGFK